LILINRIFDKMEITVNIGYDDLLAAVKKLPAAKIQQLKSALGNDLIQSKASGELSDFQNYLLQAPVMSDEQYDQYKADRKHFSSWRMK